eukprot:TRINITY_DN3148_c0_g1_i5.p2 TRINITY_DN3148_c0_g1~~TRINITY_DN3148_c0_g1_i5.p2  ORF type:complete len:135 (-),score=27.35 TRINITY_DN3148_c0_g1_i5:402-806(-)
MFVVAFTVSTFGPTSVHFDHTFNARENQGAKLLFQPARRYCLRIADRFWECRRLVHLAFYCRRNGPNHYFESRFRQINQFPKSEIFLQLLNEGNHCCLNSIFLWNVKVPACMCQMVLPNNGLLSIDLLSKIRLL